MPHNMISSTYFMSEIVLDLSYSILALSFYMTLSIDLQRRFLQPLKYQRQFGNFDT